MVNSGVSVVLFASLLLLVQAQQQCPFPVRTDLEGSQGLLAEALGITSTTLQEEPNVVCLASSSTRNQYRYASVFVSYVRDGSTTVELGQADLTCINNIWGSAILSLSPSADSSTALRSDCSLCTSASNDPAFDQPAHCIPCSGCDPNGVGVCTSTNPSSSSCCNFYDSSDGCLLTCPMGTIANAGTNFTCSDPCSPNPCANQGTCTLGSGSVTPSCSCPGSWEGDRCEECSITDCTSCSQTSGVCSECREGYTMLSGACALACRLVCENGGMLVESDCSCNCSDGFSGPTCGVGSAGNDSSCLVEDCQACSAASPMVCDQCRDGFQLDKNQEGTCTSEKKNFVGELSLGAFIGVVVGGVLLLILVLVVCIACCCCCFKSKDNVYV